MAGERARSRSSVVPGVIRGPALRISRGGVEERAGRLEPFPDQGVSLAQTHLLGLSNSQARCFLSRSPVPVEERRTAARAPRSLLTAAHPN